MRGTLLCLCLLVPASAHAKVELKHWVLRGATVYLVVSDLTQEKVQVVLAQGTVPGKQWHSESFPHMVSRTSPLAAVSGSYFDTDTNLPVCTVVSEGRLLVDGLCHSVLVVHNNKAEIKYNPSGKSRDVPWPVGCDVGLASGPILVRGGQVEKNKRDEGFSDPPIFGSARRTAVGLTKAGKLVLLGTNCSVRLNRWARMAHDAGLVDCINLDGGGSAGLYANGQFLCYPQRRLSSFLVVKVDTAR